MKITDVLFARAIALGQPYKSKAEVLNSMVDLLADSKFISEPEKVRSVIFEREKVMSTGVGKGFAFPHAKTNAANESVAALVVLQEPIDFEALDGKPVNIIFMLIGREDAVGPHLRLLSRVSRLMNNDSFRQRLVEAKNPSEILTLIHQEELQF